MDLLYPHFCLTFVGLDQVACGLQAVAPLVHGIEAAGRQVPGRLVLSGAGDLEGELVGTVVSQGDITVRPEVYGAPGLLLLPPLVHVLVVGQCGDAGLSVMLQDKQERFPVPGGGAGGVQA